MSLRALAVLLLLLIALLVSANAYRLDTHMHPNDVDDYDEPTDPSVIKRIQSLLDEAAIAKYRYAPDTDDYYYHRNRRLLAHRRPGLLRLK